MARRKTSNVHTTKATTTAAQKVEATKAVVDENGHLMGCYGAAILALGCGIEKPFSFDVADMEFVTREVVCPNCANHCEIICVYRDGELIDSWGNRCERGEIKQGQD